MFGPADLPGWVSPQDFHLAFGGNRANLVLASPAHYVKANAPPILIVQGTADTTVPESQSAELYREAQRRRRPHSAHLGPQHGRHVRAGGLPAHRPGRSRAVGGHSTAINAGNQGGFDNPKRYGHAQLWLDIGAQDPSFVAGDEQLASALHIHLHVARRPRLRILERALERLPGLLRTRARDLPVGHATTLGAA